MQLTELFEPTHPGYRSEKDDNTTIKPNEPRQANSQISLDRLNKLRIMNDVRKLENEKKLEKLKDQYKPAAGAEGGMPI